MMQNCDSDESEWEDRTKLFDVLDVLPVEAATVLPYDKCTADDRWGILETRILIPVLWHSILLYWYFSTCAYGFMAFDYSI